jgi:hypothetical protein
LHVVAAIGFCKMFIKNLQPLDPSATPKQLDHRNYTCQLHHRHRVNSQAGYTITGIVTTPRLHHHRHSVYSQATPSPASCQLPAYIITGSVSTPSLHHHRQCLNSQPTPSPASCQLPRYTITGGVLTHSQHHRQHRVAITYCFLHFSHVSF